MATNGYDFNCPQHVCSVDSFQNSLNCNSSSSEIDAISSDQSSLVKESLQDSNDEVLSTLSNEQFVVHANNHTVRSQAKKQNMKATVPRPFKFRTDERVKDVCSVDETKEFTSQLRQQKPPKHMAYGITIVKPFKLTETKKKKQDDYYLPLAEQINKIQNKTPARYHKTSQKEFQPQEHWSPKRFRPRTPNLQAVTRHRTVEALSREEEEAKVLEEMKAYEFRARPVDPKIYKPTLFEAKEIRPATKTKRVLLQTCQRSHARQEENSSETAYLFRARPVPKRILSGPVGIGEKPEAIKTKAKSPNFTTEKRLEKRKFLEQQHEVKELPSKKPKVVKKNKIVEPVKPFKPTRTKVQPFNFDKADQKRYALKEKKIQEEIEKENKPFIFRAQTLPSSEVSKLPDVKKKSPTQAQPFNFCLEIRSFKRGFRFEEESKSFKAQPASVLHKAPFIPEKPGKQTIDFQEFELHTDRRASERLKLKEQKSAEEQEKEKILNIQKAIEEENERKEIIKLRKELVHKANPIRQFKPVEIKPSSIPLTKAKSPDFATNKRLRSGL